jgi:membrane-associated phospholipid phosphatase
MSPHPQIFREMQGSRVYDIPLSRKILIGLPERSLRSLLKRNFRPLHMMEFVGHVTDFGDQAVILPIALVVSLVLAVGGCLRACLAWTVTVVGVLALILLLKVILITCGPALFEPGELRSPSGHTGSATMVYGGLVALVLQGRYRSAWPTVAAAVAVALIIGSSRLLLHVHSVAEVCIGGLVGLAGVWFMRLLAGPLPRRPPWTACAVLLIAALALTHGRHLNAEPYIIRFAMLDRICTFD